jgi:cytochrome c biogenesis protein CcdA/thiol-disulfide isomerase/thioredoxin
MFELVVIGFVAGIVAGISPCILPVLPVILVAGATTPTPAPPVADPAALTPAAASSGAARSGPGRSSASGRGTGSSIPRRPSLAVPVPSTSRWARWWGTRARPVSVVSGLVISFSVLILVGSEILSALDLPSDSLRDAGIALLIVLGLSFLFPPLATLIERPFAGLVGRFGGRQPNGKAGGFVLGLGLGVLFVPCAGPILAAITVVGATHKVGFTAVVLTVAFGAGAAVPLLIVAFAGTALTLRVRALRHQSARVRQVSGVIVIIMALTIGFNTFNGLQTDVPGYTSTLQNKIEGSSTVRQKLGALTGNSTTKNGHVATLASCNSNATMLIDCGMAPMFKDITAWLNTPGDKPLTLAQLRGKVVLVDFWTYSCINCQRTLPHIESWYKKYAKDGLVVVGVETPEFAFEHVVSNVRSQAATLGVKYPVAVDDNYGTWDAYDNEYWPADYLLDAQGTVRHIHFGEGDYSGTESFIRQLLVDAHPGLKLPPPSDVPNKTPTGEESPETYVGYTEEQYIENPSLARNVAKQYSLPSTLQLGSLALGGTWTEGSQEATSGAGAEMELGFLADDVYLVMGGKGTVQVSYNGKHIKTVNVAGVPKLYTLFNAGSTASGNLTLQVSPGVQAYDYTFG